MYFFLSKHRSVSIRNMIILFLIFLPLLSGCDLFNKDMKEEKRALGAIEGCNSKIKEVQVCLKKAGFNPGSIDGNMGWQTRKAIRDFQAVNKLSANGYINSKTWAELSIYKQPIGDSVSGLKKGKGSKKESQGKAADLQLKQINKDDKGTIKFDLKSADSIKNIQRALKKAGFNPGSIDGKLGKRTKKAIAKFKKSKGLEPNEEICLKTQEELSKYLPKEEF